MIRSALHQDHTCQLRWRVRAPDATMPARKGSATWLLADLPPGETSEWLHLAQHLAPMECVHNHFVVLFRLRKKALNNRTHRGLPEFPPKASVSQRGFHTRQAAEKNLPVRPTTSMSRIPSLSVSVRVFVLIALIMSALLSGPRIVLGQSAWYEGFEQMEPSWQRLGADVGYDIREQQRTPHIRLTGERSEWISLVGGEGGTYVHVGHEVGNARIIDELVPTIQIRSDRPGIQVLAEVTLPRSRHPQTGKPLTTLVRGTSYSMVGKWQQLRIDDLPRLLTRQTRILRNEFGPTVDPREAYVSRIVLNVYGGPGATNVWIDDLDIAGYVEAPPSSTPPIETTSGTTTSPWQSANAPTPDDNVRRRVRLDGSVLLVDDLPFFVRAVRWRGEPLNVLKVLGFNTAWLDRFPSPELLAEADQTGMWLISPAPPLPQVAPAAGYADPVTVFGSEYRSVLAWDLGEGLGDQQIDSVRQWKERLRAADSRFRRPLIARPESSLREYSRIADILVIGRPALGSSLELTDYAQWLRLRPQLARPGTPVWVVVPTDPEPTLRAQWEAMSPGNSTTMGFSAEQLRLITNLSCVSGTRGLLFESHTPLDSTDPAGETRRVILELLNLEFSLSEPWFAGGSFVAMAYSKMNPEIQAPVLLTDRAQLVIPIWAAPGSGQVPGLASQRTVSLVVPGAKEADEAYELVPWRLRRARHKHGTGGKRVTLDKFALTSQILLTQDQVVLTSCSRQARKIGPRAAELQRRLIELKMEQLERLLIPLTLAAPSTPQLKTLEADVPTLRRTAQESLQKCTQAIAGNNYADAYANAQEAMRPFRLLEREHWLAASQSVTGMAASPMLATFATLPGHWTLLRERVQRPPGTSLLAGGDFENPQAWLSAGWDHFQHSVPGVKADANLAPEAARSGALGLRLFVAPSNPDEVHQLVESPPVWITSPPVNLEARSLVVIRGWVRVPTLIEGAPDGLLVIDSLTGQALAERVLANDQWQEFVLYRACPQSGPVRVTFALSGMGTAYVDDVSIQVLTARAAPVASQVGPPVGPVR